jgi:hypothetical protein
LRMSSLCGRSFIFGIYYAFIKLVILVIRR